MESVADDLCAEWVAVRVGSVITTTRHSAGLAQLAELRDMTKKAPRIFMTGDLKVFIPPYFPGKKLEVDGFVRQRIDDSYFLSHHAGEAFASGSSEPGLILDRIGEMEGASDPENVHNGIKALCIAGGGLGVCTAFISTAGAFTVLAATGLYARHVYKAQTKFRLDHKAADDLTEIWQFFKVIEANVIAFQEDRPGYRTLRAGEIMWMTARFQDYSLDVGFYFDRKDQPRLVMVRKAPPPREWPTIPGALIRIKNPMQVIGAH